MIWRGVALMWLHPSFFSFPAASGQLGPKLIDSTRYE